MKHYVCATRAGLLKFSALISAERCGPPLRAVKDGEDLNLVLADAIGNNVRRSGDGEPPRSLDAAFAARERITGQHAHC